jgi:general secretion pathway protein H
VLIDLSNRIIRSDGDGAPLGVPASITIHSETSVGEQRSQSVAGIRFLPNGSSSGGTLRLEAGHRAYEVRVNWFTGRVTVERTS